MTSPPLASANQANRARIALFGAAIVTIVLYLVPFGKYALYPLMLFSTFVHEMGHGLTALALGGDFLYFKMWADGSGIAAYAGHFSAFGKAITAAGGLLGPPLGAAVLFALGRRANWAKTVLYAMSIICALCILLVVRNLFGIGFVALLGLVCFLLRTGHSRALHRWSSFFWQFNSAPASSRELTICSPNTRTLRAAHCLRIVNKLQWR